MEYEELQCNEVEALKAIYASDFEELEGTAAWNQRPSPKFRIRLIPSREFNSSIDVQVQFQMSQTYPRTLPRFELTRTTGLNGRQVETLRQLIEKTMKELKGNEMIFEVTSNMQSQIDEWARITSEAAPNLEEYRLQRLQLEERRQKEQQDEIQRQMEADAVKEGQKYDSLVLEELRKSELSVTETMSSEDPQSYIVVPESTSGVTTFQRIITIPQSMADYPFSFRQVMSGLKVSQQFFGSSFVSKALSPSKAQHEKSPEDFAVLLTKINLTSSYWQSPAAARQLHELNNDLEVMRQFHHPGIVPLLDFIIDRNDSTQQWEISLLTPWSRLTSLADILDTADSVSFKTAQTWAFQILEALESLHKAGLRHKCLCPDNIMIYVDPDTGETSALLRHTQYLYSLCSLNNEHAFDDSMGDEYIGAKYDTWFPPEGKLNKTTGSRSSKWDIWQFGAILVQMIAGKRELAGFQGDPEGYMRTRPRPWPPAITNFLGLVLRRDPAKRPGALELLTDQFFRTDFESWSEEFDIGGLAPSRKTTAPSPLPPSSLSVNDSTTAGSLRRRRLSNNNNDDNVFSRYKQDFDEGIVLGRGGFGQVVKSRNKLDGRVYAIKKIRATPSTLSHILQEVVLLSRLNHQYVVRYYTVWLEDDLEAIDDADGTPSSARMSEEPTRRTTPTRPSLPSRSLSRRVSASQIFDTDAQESILDAIPSSSQFSMHHSLSELDLPSGSQDFMSDSGFVEFGYSDDSQSVPQALSETDEDSTRSESAGSITPSSRAQLTPQRGTNPRTSPISDTLLSRIARISRKTLYIQMEYCENHTLGDLIRQGLYKNHHEYWRLLRQILEALAYIHGEGVIHRDLKPKNIFIDQARNIKIGDFGLARTVVQPLQSRQNSVEPAASQAPGGPANPNAEDEDLTTYVGTSLYAAVEITSPSETRKGYNEKVDIFSLGIIFFEMVWGMDTEMERIQGIKRLRSPQIELPPRLLNSKHMQTQVELIRSMLSHDATKRPSAMELLTSGNIPVEDRDMTVQEALRNIRDPHIVQQLANALFSRPLVSAQQVLYDRISPGHAERRHSRERERMVSVQSNLTTSYVHDRLLSVFRAHGAVENTSFRSQLLPRSALYKTPTVVELLDPQGTVLQLSHDLTLPHARRLAEVVPDYSKAFAFNSVYRAQPQSPGASLSKHLEVDFDIISTSDSEESLLFDEAEAIAVMYDSACHALQSELNREVPKEHERALVVVIGHHDILSASLNRCGLSPPQYYTALSLLMAGAVSRTGNALARSNVSAASMDMLSHFGFREPFSVAETHMSRLMPLSDRVRRALAHVRAVSELSKRLSSSMSIQPMEVLFSPLIHTSTSEFYTNGVIFQLLEVDRADTGVRQSSSNVSSGAVIACGGRYDSLVKSFRNSVLDSRTPVAKAVGFGMSADKLAAIASARYKQGLPRCQCLVASFSDSTLKTLGLDVLRMLWSSGFSADLARGVLSTEDLLAQAQRESIPVVVIVRQMHSQSATNKTFKPLRVRKVTSVGPQTFGDTDLAFSELVPYLQSEFGTPNSTEPVVELHNVSNSSENNHPFALDSSGDGSGNRVIVINESGKLKGGRKNRWQLEERSSEAKANFLGELNDAPLISLDLRDDVIEAIITLSPHAVEDWKRRVVGLAPNQKAYIMNVQAKLSTEASRSPRMLLFSSKTENVFVYSY